MKKCFIVFLCSILAVCAYNSAFATNNLNACKCFEIGFDDATKAYNNGNSSFFNMNIGGPSKEAMKRTPCCAGSSYQVSKSCVGYTMATRHILQYGTSKTSYQYKEALKSVRLLDLMQSNNNLTGGNNISTQLLNVQSKQTQQSKPIQPKVEPPKQSKQIQESVSDFMN